MMATYRSLEISHGSLIITTRLCSPTRLDRVKGLVSVSEYIAEMR
jgi:hypothetical protein